MNLIKSIFRSDLQLPGSDIVFHSFFIVPFQTIVVAQGNIGSEVNITVFPAQKAQKIQSIGGNYCQATYTNDARDTIGILTLKNLQPKYVRVPIPLKHWEPVNDNESPNSINYAAFKDDSVVHTLFLFLQEMKEKYGSTILQPRFGMYPTGW